ncbi:sugar ABC transporter ATP-binding protein [Arcticibacterium luteifluviistationis]|uniref:D-xylose ABC transporter ATP-binding protein n=1 Tax=Arcticibacterium luteifluviistationis TaxID=1784714 RepID=A0A2Z4GG08_9BACT|nr:sugar ABC transporter ATP-binding protein [Arcticibacterium luteifluviistationis]AWW00330.1 D-xylose ABC transporter ATP-binding protein [Arcticibacterium luteifluviistationis]
MPLLQISQISKSFSGIKVLENISFDLKSGEVHALMGENGAGKSTLMKILMGLLKADTGSIHLEGEDITKMDVQETLKKGIAMIHQEILMVPELSIAQNIFLGKETSTFSFLKEKHINQQTQELFDNIGLTLNPKTKMKDLSIAQMQMVEIVKAISNEAKIIIMDEPTSALSDKEVAKLFKIIKDLKSRNVAIVYISHKMDEIFQIADRITVLRDGNYIGTKTVKELNNKTLITMMVGREIDSIYPESHAEIGETILEVKDLTSRGKFENINFELKEGEVLGLAGLVGAGRTEVARVIAGLDKFNSGKIILEGAELKLKSPKDAIANKIGYVSEDRKALGFIPDLSVNENLTLASLPIYANGAFPVKNREESVGNHMVKDLKIKTNGLTQSVGSLSGGNQQKVVIGKVLLTSPKVIILDEPTRGIDIGAKFEIYKLIRTLSQNGIAIIMISSELPEVLGMSDRIVVLSEGKQTAILSGKEATQENIMHYAIH